MASDEEKKQHGDGKGFAGLSSMVSNIDATLASALQDTQSGPAEAPSRESAQTNRPVQNEQPQPTRKWLFGAVALIGFIWFTSQSDDNGPPKPEYSSRSSSNPVSPAPPKSQKHRVVPLSPELAKLATEAQKPQTPSRPSESKPPVGRNNVLSPAQIRYCLAEKIRLDAADAVINNYYVDRFNGYVNDYNSRCGEFRYQRGLLENARKDIEPYRGQLQAEGRNRFVRSPSAATRTPAQASQSVRPSPDATVQAIQRRLNDLGYAAGPADGLFGRKTRAAIRAFQRNNGIAPDGVASSSLLSQLNASARNPIRPQGELNMRGGAVRAKQ